MATSPLPSPGPKRGRDCYVTPPFLGSPIKRGQNQNWLPPPWLLGGPKEGGIAMQLCILGGPQHQAQQRNHKWLPHPCLLGAQKRAELLCHPCILGHPQTKGDDIRNGYLTPAFLGAQKRGQLLRNPCILGGSQR